MKLMNSMSKEEMLRALWKLYTNQKRYEEEAGVDTESDRKRMREWFIAVSDGDADESALERKFPDPLRPVNVLVCGRCDDKGWHFNYRAKFTVRSPRGDATQTERLGYSICSCQKGRDKNRAVSDHGRPREKGRGKNFA